MNIEWPALAAAVVAVGLSHLFLLRRLRLKHRELKRLEAEHRLISGELLHVRSQAAREMAQAADANSKRVRAVEANMRDLAGVLKTRR